MQNIDCVCKLGNVDYTKCPIFLSNSNLFHALTNSIHRLPVVRVQSFLYLVKLKTSLPPHSGRKAAKIVQRPPPKLDWLDAYVHNPIIQNNAYMATKTVFAGKC